MGARKLDEETWESYAERLIQQAQQDGAFDHLPGFGQPSPLMDSPYDEHWWVRRKLQGEQLNAMPPALAIRDDVRSTLSSLADLCDEVSVRESLVALNERIRHANQSGRPGPASTTLPVDVEAIVAEWRRGQPTDG